MDLQSKHFNPSPWSWDDARRRLRKPIAGGSGGQGAIFGCEDAFEGAVVKLYKQPRSRSELERVQALIRTCKGLPPAQPATTEWFKRLNLPLRPLLDPQGAFGGVVLPPLPAQVNAREYRYDSKRGFVAENSTVLFEAQLVTRKSSPVGPATEQWQWRLLTSLAETVALMHSVNLVHGDLSLSNVLALQKDETHSRDVIYLIDIDDAFLDDGMTPCSTTVRKSRLTYDPFSVRAEQVSKATDVFVVALWAVAFMQYQFVTPETIAQSVPPAAMARLKTASKELPDVIQSALGPIGSRPTAFELYQAIRAGAPTRVRAQ